MRDSVIAGNALDGVQLLADTAGETSRAEFEHTSFSRNGSWGLYVNAALGSSSVHASNINSSGNADDGVLVDGAGATLTVTASTMTRNGGSGMSQANGATLRSPGNNIVDGNVGGATNGTITSITPM